MTLLQHISGLGTYLHRSHFHIGFRTLSIKLHLFPTVPLYEQSYDIQTIRPLQQNIH